MQKKSPSIYIIILILFCASALSGISSDIYIAALPDIVLSFGIQATSSQLIISLFFIGLGTSQIVYGPLSDSFGRKKILSIGSIIFVLGTLLCIFSNNFNIFLLGRLIQGVGVGAMACISRAITKDMFQGRLLVKVLSYVGMGLAIVPAIAPILGSYIQHYVGWRYEFVFMLLYLLSLQLAITLLIPETNKYIAIKSIKTIIKEYSMILSDLVFLANVIIASLIISMIYIFYLVTSFYFQNYYGWTELQYSQVAILVAISLLTGRQINIYLISFIKGNQIILLGSVISLVGSIFTYIIFYLGYNPVFAVLLAMCLYSFGGGMIFANTFIGATYKYIKSTGSVSALYGVVQMTVVFFLISISSMIDTFNLLVIFIFIFVFALLSTIMSIYITKK